MGDRDRRTTRYASAAPLGLGSIVARGPHIGWRGRVRRPLSPMPVGFAPLSVGIQEGVQRRDASQYSRAAGECCPGDSDRGAQRVGLKVRSSRTTSPLRTWAATSRGTFTSKSSESTLILISPRLTSVTRPKTVWLLAGGATTTVLGGAWANVPPAGVIATASPARITTG